MIIIFIAMIDHPVYYMRLLGSRGYDKNCVGGDMMSAMICMDYGGSIAHFANSHKL